MSGIFDRHISGGAGKVISLDVHRAEYRLWHIAHLRTKLSPNMETGLLY